MNAVSLSAFSDSSPPPPDFDDAFIRFGRLALEEHYNAGRVLIDRWLDERGKTALIAKRAAFVKKTRQRPHITRKDMTAILTQAFPVRMEVGYTLARHAAQHLRIRRNGGWIVSQAQGGMWWVGSRRRTAAELLAMAIAVGFDPASLSGEHPFGIGCDQP